MKTKSDYPEILLWIPILIATVTAIGLIASCSEYLQDLILGPGNGIWPDNG